MTIASRYFGFWLQEYALQLRMNEKSAKSAKAIERNFKNDCGDQPPALHDLLVNAAHLIRELSEAGPRR